MHDASAACCCMCNKQLLVLYVVTLHYLVCDLVCFMLAHHRYSGGRTADDIISFVNSKSGEFLCVCLLFMCVQSVAKYRQYLNERSIIMLSVHTYIV